MFWFGQKTKVGKFINAIGESGEDGPRPKKEEGYF